MVTDCFYGEFFLLGVKESLHPRILVSPRNSIGYIHIHDIRWTGKRSILAFYTMLLTLPLQLAMLQSQPQKITHIVQRPIKLQQPGQVPPRNITLSTPRLSVSPSPYRHPLTTRKTPPQPSRRTSILTIKREQPGDTCMKDCSILQCLSGLLTCAGLLLVAFGVIVLVIFAVTFFLRCA